MTQFEFNPECRLRLRYIRCAPGSRCGGFKEAFFGARGMMPIYGGGGFRLIYDREWGLTPVPAPREEAA